MNKIPIKPKTIIREASCIWEFLDENDALQKEKVTVRYKGRTVADARAFQSNLANREENETIYLSEILAERLYQIPEILGKEIVTLEFLESQDIRNLTALNEAIADAENPEKK